MTNYSRLYNKYRHLTANLEEIYDKYEQDISKRVGLSLIYDEISDDGRMIYGSWKDVYVALVHFLCVAPNEISDSLYCTPQIPNIMPVIAQAQALVCCDAYPEKSLNRITPGIIAYTCELIYPLVHDLRDTTALYALSHPLPYYTDEDIQYALEQYELFIKEAIYTRENTTARLHQILELKDIISSIAGIITLRYADELLFAINACESKNKKTLGQLIDDTVPHPHIQEDMKLFAQVYTHMYETRSLNSFDYCCNLGRCYVSNDGYIIPSQFFDIFLIDWEDWDTIIKKFKSNNSIDSMIHEMDDDTLNDNYNTNVLDLDTFHDNICLSFITSLTIDEGELAQTSDAPLINTYELLHKKLIEYAAAARNYINNLRTTYNLDIFKTLAQKGVQVICITDISRKDLIFSMPRVFSKTSFNGEFLNNSLENSLLMLAYVDTYDVVSSTSMFTRYLSPFVQTMINAYILQMPTCAIVGDELSQAISECLTSINTCMSGFTLKNGLIYPLCKYQDISNNISMRKERYFKKTNEGKDIRIIHMLEYLSMYSTLYHSAEELKVNYYLAFLILFTLVFDKEYPKEFFGFDEAIPSRKEIEVMRKFLAPLVIKMFNILLKDAPEKDITDSLKELNDMFKKLY